MPDPIDTDAERADACHCRQSLTNPDPAVGVEYHFSDCRVHDIAALCDEVDRLRSLLARCVDHIDPNDSDAAYRLLVECEEASRG